LKRFIGIHENKVKDGLDVDVALDSNNPDVKGQLGAIINTIKTHKNYTGIKIVGLFVYNFKNKEEEVIIWNQLPSNDFPGITPKDILTKKTNSTNEDTISKALLKKEKALLKKANDLRNYPFNLASQYLPPIVGKFQDEEIESGKQYLNIEEKTDYIPVNAIVSKPDHQYDLLKYRAIWMFLSLADSAHDFNSTRHKKIHEENYADIPDITNALLNEYDLEETVKLAVKYLLKKFAKSQFTENDVVGFVERNQKFFGVSPGEEFTLYSVYPENEMSGEVKATVESNRFGVPKTDTVQKLKDLMHSIGKNVRISVDMVNIKVDDIIKLFDNDDRVKFIRTNANIFDSDTASAGRVSQTTNPADVFVSEKVQFRTPRIIIQINKVENVDKKPYVDAKIEALFPEKEREIVRFKCETCETPISVSAPCGACEGENCKEDCIKMTKGLSVNALSSLSQTLKVSGQSFYEQPKEETFIHETKYKENPRKHLITYLEIKQAGDWLQSILIRKLNKKQNGTKYVLLTGDRLSALFGRVLGIPVIFTKQEKIYAQDNIIGKDNRTIWTQNKRTLTFYQERNDPKDNLDFEELWEED
jgi:hypothetical protein